MSRLLLVAVLVLMSRDAVGAQFDSWGRDARITVGSRVRFVRDTGAARLEGRVLSLLGDSIDVEVPSSLRRQRFSLRDMAGLEVHRRDPSFTTALAAIGFLGGAVAYVNWCLDNRDECRRLEDEERNDDDDQQVTTLFSAMSIGGLLVGGALGYLLTPSTWVQIERPLRFGVLPTRSGVMVYASLQVP